MELTKIIAAAAIAAITAGPALAQDPFEESECDDPQTPDVVEECPPAGLIGANAAGVVAGAVALGVVASGGDSSTTTTTTTTTTTAGGAE
ncbi:hypothetical protein [Roseovarius salis]|uniref:hypothetical protein n=1 Tax=Roseovarius salis TaxID=3376063 RepID=UPI0037C839C0